nr:oxysterol-binding protein homolog 1-like [Ipomoea batatas]
MPDTIERPCTDDNVFSFFVLKKDVKVGSIFDPHGFMTYVLNKEFGKKVLQCIKDGGLYTFVTYDPKEIHLLDIAQIYINSRIPEDENKQEIDEIRSNVIGIDVTIAKKTKKSKAAAAKGASISKGPEPSKAVETKKKRNAPEKRKVEPSKRPSKKSKTIPPSLVSEATPST